MDSRRRLHLILGALAVIAVLLVLWVVLKPKPQPQAAPHAVPVLVAKAAAKDTPLEISTLGAAQAWTSDTIFAQVNGRLLKVNFTEGSDVKAGQVLAEVDPRPYEAILTQAEGTLKRDTALLAGARRDLVRYQHLLAENAIARQTVEDQAATVAQDEGAVQIDRGNVQAARINLEFCHITSPISGRAGVRLVDPGNLVSASGSVASTPNTSAATSTAAPGGSSVTAASNSGGGGGGGSASSGGSGIVIINQIQPIAVTFTVPQGEFQRLVAASDGFRKALAVQALSQETGEVLDSGEVRIVDNRVDPATGTVQLKAKFPNAHRRLWPGQFVNVRLTLQTIPHAVVVPQTAVNRGPNGLFAFVLGADNHAAIRQVKVLANAGDVAIIESGVQPGETVVVDGQMTLKDGSLVRVVQNAPAAGGARS